MNSAIAYLAHHHLGFYEIENSNLTEVPANDVYYLGKAPLWNNPLIDWLQYTTPQAGLNNESILFSQGHTLGGGSARNFMWVRGSRLENASQSRLC